MNKSSLPVAIIGAGPVGLAAAAHLHERGIPFVVLESGSAVGAAIREWGHVRMFSPWKFAIDAAAARLLEPAGWVGPGAESFPTGRDLVTRYLEPLGAHPAIAPHLRFDARVTGVVRDGFDRMKTPGRTLAPFRIRTETPGGTTELMARAVIDASGTWTNPNPLGGSGLPALGEPDAGHLIDYRIPDVLGADRPRYEGRRILVVGSGHSAFNVLLDLVRLQAETPATRVAWAIRRRDIRQLFGGGTKDQLEERGRLGNRVKALVDRGSLELLTGFTIDRISPAASGVMVHSSSRLAGPFDRIAGATGFRPSFEMLSEIRLDLDPVTEAPAALAPLIDPNVHSCGSVPPHGFEELKHQDPDIYLVGMKSYGRAPTFLLLTGYEQVRSVAAAVAGDLEAARKVELVLPETGVCSTELGDQCCGAAAAEPVLLGLGRPTSGPGRPHPGAG